MLYALHCCKQIFAFESVGFREGLASLLLGYDSGYANKCNSQSSRSYCESNTGAGVVTAVVINGSGLTYNLFNNSLINRSHVVVGEVRCLERAYAKNSTVPPFT